MGNSKRDRNLSPSTQVLGTYFGQVPEAEDGMSLGQDQLEILKYSKSCIDESPSIRMLTMLYSERKYVFFFLVHLVCTMLCWQHFMYSKFRVTEDT